MRKYQVIYCDPPWSYNSRKAGAERKDPTKFGGGAEKHYSLMPDSELLAMRGMIDILSAENCSLFMWATCPRLDFGVELVKAWGFRYVTVAFVWEKIGKDNDEPIFNPGFYTASNAELVLLGVRGSMRPATPMIQQVVRAPRGTHSRKPDTVRHRIELMYPEASRIELFARSIDSLFQPHSEWDVWGNQIVSDLELASTPPAAE